MHLAAASTAHRLRSSFQLLLALGLVLAVPGLGQATPSSWRVTEEEEQNSRDSGESATDALAEDLNQRGRSRVRRLPVGWRPAEHGSAAADPVARTSDVHVKTTHIFNGCGAFLRC
ncbi:MAG: hypothetical protein AB7U73_21865 [Pirellulales bacterium]